MRYLFLGILYKTCEIEVSFLRSISLVIMMFFWVLSPCRFVGRRQRFGETYCLDLEPRRWRQYVSSKRSNLSTSQQDDKTQKNIIILAVKTSNFTQYFSKLNIFVIHNYTGIWKTGRNHLEDLGIDGRILLKCIWIKYRGGENWMAQGRIRWRDLENAV
jgi:hypothetical protein